MKVQATRTTYAEVDVKESNIIKCTLSMFDKKYKINIKGSYINEDGYWMKFDYCHPSQWG